MMARPRRSLDAGSVLAGRRVKSGKTQWIVQFDNSPGRVVLRKLSPVDGAVL
jgi:hypothetical protein